MKSRATERLLLICLPLIILCGCKSIPATKGDVVLRGYISKESFTPFVPPRSADGVGAIISFDPRGEETIVASALNCFSPTTVIPARESIAVLENQFDLTSDDSVALSLPAAIGRKIDFSTSLGSNGVAKVKFQLIDPFLVRITLFDAQTHIQSMAPGSLCLKYLSNPDNVVIHTVLGAKGVEYTFYDKNENKLVLTASLLSTLKVDPSLSRTSKGTSSLSLKDSEMLFGYRGWKGIVFKGIGEGGLQLAPLKPAEIENLRAQKTKIQ